MIPVRRFGHFDIACLSRSQLVDTFFAAHSEGVERAQVVMDANGHALSLAQTSSVFRNSIAQADLIHADGGFLVTMSQKVKGNVIPERSATTDMIHDFAAAFEKSGHSFFLLGADEETNRDCAKKLQLLYPNLKIVGRHHGFFSEEEEQDVIAQINAVKPDVVWVGLGKPKEQSVSLRLRDQINATWIITCGGCYNYITGAYPRAPQWMQNNNLEWLHRMLTNPQKLFWRYLVTTPHALWIVGRGALK
ncbi:WecB/TagA/CpsF family glycosyltransferase [Celeribacter sp.]|uniref:WecB/TagA/CpsF family glycosyltransferase n=1 Tax=Celeribacter sp. TaxID=1890673 RepID=UPI003A914430